LQPLHQQEKFKERQKTGFKPPRTGRPGDVIVVGETGKVPLSKRIADLFDPTVTPITLINELVVYAAMALW
jgi:hypothetical protein